MSLTARIERAEERRQSEVQPIVERRQPKQPEWLRRMQEQGLPPKDYTGRSAA